MALPAGQRPNYTLGGRGNCSNDLKECNSFWEAGTGAPEQPALFFPHQDHSCHPSKPTPSYHRASSMRAVTLLWGAQCLAE